MDPMGSQPLIFCPPPEKNTSQKKGDTVTAVDFFCLWPTFLIHMHPYLLSSHQILLDIMAVKAEGMQISTIFSCVFFGTNFLLCVLFQLIQRSGKKTTEVDSGKKKLSKPFEGTLQW
jgi:hypothetical protein